MSESVTGILDGQDELKLHTGAIPRLGGIFFTVFLGTILYGDIDHHTRGFLAGGVVIFLTGLTDDRSLVNYGDSPPVTCSVAVQAYPTDTVFLSPTTAVFA